MHGYGIIYDWKNGKIKYEGEFLNKNIIFQFKITIFQIYKQQISHLLTRQTNFKIKQNLQKPIYLHKLTQLYLLSFHTFLNYLHSTTNFSSIKLTQSY